MYSALYYYKGRSGVRTLKSHISVKNYYCNLHVCKRANAVFLLLLKYISLTLSMSGNATVGRSFSLLVSEAGPACQTSTIATYSSFHYGPQLFFFPKIILTAFYLNMRKQKSCIFVVGSNGKILLNVLITIKTDIIFRGIWWTWELLLKGTLDASLKSKRGKTPKPLKSGCVQYPPRFSHALRDHFTLRMTPMLCPCVHPFLC